MLILLTNHVYSQTTYYDNYAFRIPLTLNNSSLGISTDQTNFVALLKVTSPNFVSGVCSDQTGGISSSIPVFAIIDSAYSTATELYYQVENYNTTTGVIYFWVRIPDLYKSASNKLYCYFGSTNPSVTHSTAWQKLTWSSVTATAGINYSGVWHFNEDPSGAAPQFSDATVNNNNLTVGSFLGSAGSVTQNTASQIGNGITLSATSVLDTAATALPNTTASQTLSLWASYPSTPTHTANLIVLENGANPATTGNGTQLGVLINGGTTTLQTWRWANRLTPLVSSSTIPSAVTWHHYAYAYDSVANKSYLYLDGALLAGPTSNSSNKPYSGKANMVSFGDYINNQIPTNGPKIVGGQSYSGTMDESHVIGATLSADWIKAEYVNQKNPDAFTTAGAMQTNSLRASAVAGYLVYTWKGLSTSITSASNWINTTTGVTEAPVNGNVNWVIPAGLAHYPVLTADTALYGLTIAAGAYINLNGHTLKVGCNIYNSSGGQIMYASSSSSKIKWNGSNANQYYYGANTALTAELGAMEVNNSSAGTVTISGGPVDIFNLLTITKGNLVIGSSPAALTLKSTSTLTASVSAIPAAYSITGNVSVERYISGGTSVYRGYRLLSSPIYTASSGSNHYFDLSYLLLYAPVTGTLGTAGGLTKTGNPSMYLYRDNVAFTNGTFNTGNFRGVNTINNSPLYNIGVDYDGTFSLHPGTGVMFFYRGNLSNIATKYFIGTVAEANTFVSTGTLNQQAVTVTNWYTQLSTLQYSTVAGNAGYSGYNLVGNPYASSIDWNTFSTTSSTAGIYGPNVGPTIYIFNEVSKVYATYNGALGTNGGTSIIPSGQGFFVKATASGASLTFNEAAKTNSQYSGPTQATGNTLLLAAHHTTNKAPQYLRLELAADSVNKEETIVSFDNSSKNQYAVNEDSQFLPGSGEVSLSSMSADNVKLAINTIPYPKLNPTTVKLNVNAATNGQYNLNTTGVINVPQLYQVWLKDAYNKDSSDIRHNSSYKFNVSKSDTNSFGSNRFTLVIRQDPALGLHLLDFAVAWLSDGAEITWKTENEQNYTNFIVERSCDGGVTFHNLDSLASGSLGGYSFLDKKPAPAADQYRLKLVDLNGGISYSKVVTLIFGNSPNTVANTSIAVYPNPAASTINLSINQNTDNTPKSSASSFDINIRAINGSIVKSSVSSQPAWQENVSGLMPGTYIVEVINNNDKSLVGKSKFVKL
ncbi:MAG: DUF2341 domain-containing protein [Sphingobacteriales bacterium]